MWSLRMWITSFRMHTSSLLQAIKSVEYPSPICLLCSGVVWWNCTAVIDASFGSVSQCGPLSHGFPAVVFLDRRHPGFWDSDSIVPVVVVRMKSYVNCLFYPACEWMGITINKLYSVLALWDGRGLCLVESDILVVFLDSILHRFASGFADVNLSALTGNPVHHAILLSRVIGILKAF